MASSSGQDDNPNNSPPRVPALNINALIDSAVAAQSNAVSPSGYVTDVAAYFQSTMSGRPASSTPARKRTAAVAFDEDEDMNEDVDENKDKGKDKDKDDDKATAPLEKAVRIYRKATDDVRRVKTPAKLSQRRKSLLLAVTRLCSTPMITNACLVRWRFLQSRSSGRRGRRQEEAVCED